MSYHIPQLQHISLFQNIDPLHLETMLQCLNPVKRHYPKDAVIFLANDSLTAVGIVLSGKIPVSYTHLALKKPFTASGVLDTEVGRMASWASWALPLEVKRRGVGGK